MKFHIVRNKETLEDVLYIYNLTKDELIEHNKHIRVWDKLIPGTKLKIPPITDAVELEVSDIEPFVEDYYPSINEGLNDNNFIKPSEEIKETKPIEINENPVSSKIYEEYEDLNNSLKEKNNNKPKVEDEDEEEEEIPKRFSNLKTKPVFNNYYPYYLGIYNAPRYIPYPIIYYPVYYPKKPN